MNFESRDETAWSVVKQPGGITWSVERLQFGRHTSIQYLTKSGKVSSTPSRFRSEAAARAALAKAA